MTFIERRFRLLCAVPLTLMAALQITSAREESQTFDEAVHLSAGYRYWRTGHFTMNREHPPLQKLLSAAPLLILRPPLPSDPSLADKDFEYARTFLYQSPVNADRMLFLGRMATILLTAGLGAALAWAGAAFFGAPAALLAVTLFALDPNFIAHGHYVTTDVAAALFFFLTTVLWIRHLQQPGKRWAVGAGVSFGLALASKFSVVLLAVVLPLLLLLWRLAGVRGHMRRNVRALGVVAVSGFLIVGLVYAPETWRTLRGRNRDAPRITVLGVKLPPHTFFSGLETVLAHNEGGHPAYLLGELSDKGWWYYFPVAFGVKSPSALLLAMGLGLGLAVWRARRWKGGVLWLALLLPPVLYFGVSLTSHINIGLRHLLPVYPFLYLLTAAAVVTALPVRAAMAAACLLLGVQAAEAASIHPHYLTFFNTFAGGPKAGPRYLLDSNLDWGQDLKNLKIFLDDNHLDSVCLFYFGYASPSYYGIKERYLPRTWDKDERERMDCIGAISVTLLHDLYIPPGSYEWLRHRTPLGTVGNSIYIYDLRKRQ